MRIAVFSTKPYDEKGLSEAASDSGHDLTYFEARLTAATATLAADHDAVCAFVNDELDRACLSTLRDLGVQLVLMRCAGYNRVDLAAADEFGLTVARVPAYSPYAVAEHTIALMLGLNRRLHRAHSRVRNQDFSLDGLQGFDMHGKTIGIVGTGTIGTVFARLMRGFHCEVLAYDPYPNDEVVRLRGTYVELDELFERSKVISLHCPLTPDTHHLVDERRLKLLPEGALVVNTSRGGLIDTKAAIEALKSGELGGLALDVYEEEAELFFEDRSEQILTDDVFARLLSFPNVLITSHQAFFTNEALANIAQTTIANADAVAAGEPPEGLVEPA
ncbi:2-hydroxyacid dehydrogenase [Euzebya tangerina]|uniref:2-hydroxyacid dehydrogenase n=1 Tax=Euzebya tangerina TaxID=591198 RepID=UPI000E30ECF1|nr:2-hydroxyacid dehydrogenase [Euzebya tangerina]